MQTDHLLLSLDQLRRLFYPLVLPHSSIQPILSILSIRSNKNNAAPEYRLFLSCTTLHFRGIQNREKSGEIEPIGSPHPPLGM